MKIFFRWLDRLLDTTVCMVLAVMTIVVAVNVFCRFVLSFSLSWGDETAQILLVWMTFLGAAIAMRNDSHYAFDYLVRSLPSKAGMVFTVVNRLIVIAMTALLIYWSGDVTIQISRWVMPATGISRSLVYGACPVGGLFMLLYALRNFATDCGSLGKIRKQEDRKPVEET
ncbi:TRAP transporter small permease [bacterium]|nr:TRAP transporter small permease [bacterium]